jgi:hypothetical protein
MGTVQGGFTIRDRKQKVSDPFEFDNLQRRIEFDFKGPGREVVSLSDDGNDPGDESGIS